jgi:hypothetical protein
MKIRLIIIVFIAFSFEACENDEYFSSPIKIETEIVDIKNDSIYLRSILNLSSNKITEHGHCWSCKYSEPIIDFSSFSCLGSLTGATEFEEKLNIDSKENLHIRAFVIVDSHIVYGKTQIVQ